MGKERFFNQMSGDGSTERVNLYELPLDELLKLYAGLTLTLEKETPENPDIAFFEEAFREGYIQLRDVVGEVIREQGLDSNDINKEIERLESEGAELKPVELCIAIPPGER